MLFLNFTKRIKFFIFNLFVLNLFFIIFLYFTYSGIYGNFGLIQNIKLEFKITELKKELSTLENNLIEFEKKTSKLHNNLDLDLLDQQARSILGLIRNDEIMIIN